MNICTISYVRQNKLVCYWIINGNVILCNYALLRSVSRTNSATESTELQLLYIPEQPVQLYPDFSKNCGGIVLTVGLLKVLPITHRKKTVTFCSHFLCL